MNIIPRLTTNTAGIIIQAILFASLAAHSSEGQNTLRITHAQLADQMKGGLVGQLFGNLNGLVHEMAYILSLIHI